MKKISIRMEENMLQEVDNLVDYIRVKNRSQAIKLLLKKALGREKIAVILSKGSDKKGHNLEKDLLINKTEYNSIAKIKNTTLIEEQVKRLKKYGFNIIYIISIPKILENIKRLLKHGKTATIHYISIDKNMKTADALRLLKDKIYSPFLTIFSDVFFEADLNSIYEQQIGSKEVCTLMLTSSKEPSKKGNVKVEGTKIISFIEKPSKVESPIVFEPIFAANPQIFDVKGSSLSYDIFPELTKKGLLAGHLSTGSVAHIHNDKDKKRIELLLKC